MLSQRFSAKEDSIFEEKISEKIVPADGLAIYLKSIWDKIVSNKDLDLPNQQQLLAQYRCDEIIASIYDWLTSQGILQKDTLMTIEELVNNSLSLKNSCLGMSILYRCDNVF